MKISILKCSLRKCPQNKSLRKCPQNIYIFFENDIFKLYYESFVGSPDADSRLTGIPILTHIDWFGGNFDFQNDPYFPTYRKFGFCDRSVNMTDFDTKMRAEGVSYAFDLHLNKWNSYPWHQFSWKLIFKVTPPNLAISAHPKIHIFWKKTRLWVKFRNFCISIKTWDLQLYSLEIWSISGMNSRNASHFTYRAFFVRSR